MPRLSGLLLARAHGMSVPCSVSSLRSDGPKQLGRAYGLAFSYDAKSRAQMLWAKKADFSRFMDHRANLIDKGIIHRALVPLDRDKRYAVATCCAASHTGFNRSDPFASARAISAVMNGW